jgi:hypothetical protein
MPEAPTCARAQVLMIIKATGSTATSNSRVKNERSSPDTPQNDIEPPITPRGSRGPLAPPQCGLCVYPCAGHYTIS